MRTTPAAMRDLTLRAHKAALWGSRPGFGSTAKFARRADDADVRVGPANNDKLHLKTCTEAWTIEAWIRYTGPGWAGTGRSHVRQHLRHGRRRVRIARRHARRLQLHAQSGARRRRKPR